MKRPGHAARFGKVGFLDVRSWTKDVFPGLRRPGGPGDTISFQLPSTGDYVVEVLPGMGEQTDYSITITIPG